MMIVTPSTLFMLAVAIEHNLKAILAPSYPEIVKRRGWDFKDVPIQDPEDRQRLTCPVCGQRWLVLLDDTFKITDELFLCPHGCLRQELKTSQGGKK